jgi:hypothetical protein
MKYNKFQKITSVPVSASESILLMVNLAKPETKNLTEPIEFVKSFASSVNEIARLFLPSGGYDWHKY